MKDFLANVWRRVVRRSRPVGMTATTLGHGVVVDGRFAIKRLLGFGGSSAVYVAEQRSMGREVALKVLRSEVITHEQALDRFLRETQAVSRLTSPHTISVYDVGRTDDGLLYIAMELLKGRPLFQQMTDEPGPVSIWRAVNIVDQVLDSLDEAHELGVLHRDLKPENIFVIQGAGSSEFAKVLDFGIAELTDMPSTRDSDMGLVVGTPRYMSPEQMEGKDLDPRTDLYSLATILFELLAGVPPFEADSPLALALKKIRETPPTIGDVNPRVRVPKEIELFLERALSRDPDKRPESASEFKNLLTLAMEDQEPEAEGDAPPETMVRLGVAQPPPESPRPEPTPPRRTSTPPGGVPRLEKEDQAKPAPKAPAKEPPAEPPPSRQPLHPEDRRTTARQRRTIATRFKYEGKECRATTTDISPDGAFLFSRVLPELGRRLEFVFLNPGRASFMIHISGTVVRTVEKPSAPGEVRGFAIHWVFPASAKKPRSIPELFGL